VTQYNDALFRLHKQIDRAAQLRASIPVLMQRHNQLSVQVKGLRKSMLREQRDVDKLEGRTLTALYYRASGTIGAKLDKERLEATATKEEYDIAAEELKRLEAELTRSKAELAELEGCEARYQTLLAEKLEALKTRGGEDAAHITSMEKRIDKLERQKKEVQDAVIAGKALLRVANQMSACLGSAEKQSIADLTSTGVASELFDFAKHSNVKEAVSYLDDFRVKLTAFQDKLAKITAATGIRINLDEFQHIGTAFQTGFITDHSFHHKLKSAQTELQNTVKRIEQTLTSLKELTERLMNDQERMRAKLDKLVLNAK
jgi:predicted nuclease with TOPRIM domain